MADVVGVALLGVTGLPTRSWSPTFRATPEDAAELSKGRNVVERFFDRFKQWRGLATHYDKLALTHRGGVVLRAITIWGHRGVGSRASLPALRYAGSSSFLSR